MDNIEVVPEYSRALGVPMLMADFEAITDAQIREWTATERFALITMVHVFEHMYDPLAALAKLRRLVADDGRAVRPAARSRRRRLRARPHARPLHDPSVLPRAAEPARDCSCRAGDLFTIAPHRADGRRAASATSCCGR